MHGCCDHDHKFARFDIQKASMRVLAAVKINTGWLICCKCMATFTINGEFLLFQISQGLLTYSVPLYLIFKQEISDGLTEQNLLQNEGRLEK